MTKLPISFDHFDNFETGCVLYFVKHETTKLSAFCRALVFGAILTTFEWSSILGGSWGSIKK